MGGPSLYDASLGAPQRYDPAVPQQGFGAPRGHDPAMPQQGFGAPRGYDPAMPQQGFGAPQGHDPAMPQQGFGAPQGHDPAMPQQGFGAPQGYVPAAPQQGMGAPPPMGSPYDAGMAPGMGASPGYPGSMVAAAGPGAMVPAGGFGPVGNVRNPMVVLLVGWVCFIYAIVVLWSQLNELKDFRRKDDINPILLFIPILNLLLLWQLPDKVLEAKRMAGIPNPQVSHPVLYVFLAGYSFTSDMNEVFEAAARQQGGAPPPQGHY